MSTLRGSLFLVAMLTANADAACPVPGFKYAAFADTGISVNGGAKTNSYDSSSGNNATTNSNGNLGTNGTGANTITVQGGAVINGTVDTPSSTPASVISVGNNSSTQGLVTSAGPTTLTPVTIPTVGTNQGNKSVNGQNSLTLAPNQTYGDVSCNGNSVNLSAGTYVMKTLDLNGQCTLNVTSGPIVLYMSGTSLHLNGGSVTNSTLKSTDLVIMSSTLTDVEINGGANAAFALYAPNAQAHVNGNADLYGAIVSKKLELNGGGIIHYDRALGSLGSTAISCSSTEISRATPIIAPIYNGTSTQTCVVQGSYEFPNGSATTVTSTADITNFVFPFVQGHVRARKTADVTTSAQSFNDTTTTPLFDAGTGIPTVTTSGCAKNGGRFTTSCRNVFTNTNASSSTGTTWHPTMTSVDDTTANANVVGPLLTAGLSNFALADHQALIRKVLKGTSGGTVAKLGGVDRSTVAVIGPSSVAGKTGSVGASGARPSMVYFGGMDGMLHAVCASSGGSTGKGTANETEITNYCVLGQELWAFIPRVQLPLIRQNKARIDGSVRVVDAFGDFTTSTGTSTKSWRTILTFQTGYADSTAKPAVYALDVTDPSQPSIVWEYTPPSSPSTLDLGVGLAMHAGPTIINGAIVNLAIAETNNGGTGTNLLSSSSPTNAGTGVVVRALSLELGTKKWGFEYAYPSPPRTVANDANTIPVTGVPGGAVGIDLTNNGFTTHVTFGDLYGNLWMLKAPTGTSSTGSATTPLFSFSSNRHPIGALPTIIDNGSTKIAAFGSGGYVDTSTANSLWATGVQNVVGVKLSTTATSASSESSTAGTATAAPLLFKKDLTSGENVAGQVLAIGSQIFFTTDNSQFNQANYGNTGSNTGNSYSLDFISTTPTIVTMGAIRGGASGLNNDTVSATATMYSGASDKTQKLGTTATSTTGNSVDYQSKTKTTRMVWLRNAQ